jgi:hypothetical protein
VLLHFPYDPLNQATPTRSILEPVMRRTLLFALLAALAVPAAALATQAAPGDGTLSVREGEGTVQLELRGAILGRIGSGTLRIDDPKAGHCDGPLVWGADVERSEADFAKGEFELRCIYTGTNMRFRLTGGDHDITIVRGRDVAISAVGRGNAFLRGRGWLTGLPDGTYSIDGRDYVSLPDAGKEFEIGTPLGTSPGTVQ